MRGRRRQAGVAEREPHLLDREAERLGRHLRHRRLGAGAHVARGAPTSAVPSGRSRAIAAAGA